DRESDLTGDSFGQGDLLARPPPWNRAMQCKDTDELVEHDDRNGQDGTRAEVEQRLAPTQGRIVEILCSFDVFDRHGLAPCDSEVRRGQPPGGLDRRQPRPLPLRGGNVASSTEPDETTFNPERSARL